MSTKTKSSRTMHRPVEEMRAEMSEKFMPMYTKTIERVAEFQKNTLDMAAQQNQEWMNLWKNVAGYFPQFPGMFMFDMWGNMFDRYVDTQKEMLDMAVNQNEKAADMMDERSGSMKRNADHMNEWFQQTVDHTVAMQKKGMDFVAEQQKTAYETMKRQFHLANFPAAEALQNGVEMLMETQKAMLDVAAKPLYHAAEAA